MPIVTDVNSTVKESKTGDNNYPVLMDTLNQEMIIEVNIILFRLGVVLIILLL